MLNQSVRYKNERKNYAVLAFIDITNNGTMEK